MRTEGWQDSYIWKLVGVPQKMARTAKTHQDNQNTKGFLCLTKEFAPILQQQEPFHVLCQSHRDQTCVWKVPFCSRKGRDEVRGFRSPIKGAIVVTNLKQQEVTWLLSYI